ncbi:MAG: hypothetical protein MK438_10115, partial [SAR324 cluster bacterium]|nr:hypothetical protein [SAR324 cluster bacterium]
EGITGLGETFYAPEAVEAYIHSNIAPNVLGLPAQDIELIHHRTRHYIGFVGAGVELRARSALDIALWDAFGKALGQPVSMMLGESSGVQHLCRYPLCERPQIRYNQ